MLLLWRQLLRQHRCNPCCSRWGSNGGTSSGWLACKYAGASTAARLGLGCQSLLCRGGLLIGRGLATRHCCQLHECSRVLLHRSCLGAREHVGVQQGRQRACWGKLEESVSGKPVA